MGWDWVSLPETGASAVAFLTSQAECHPDDGLNSSELAVLLHSTGHVSRAVVECMKRS
jgi:hypothetical protein